MKIDRSIALEIINEERAYAAARGDGLWTDPAPEYTLVGESIRLFTSKRPKRLQRVMAIVKEAFGSSELKVKGMLAEAQSISRHALTQNATVRPDACRLMHRLEEVAEVSAGVLAESFEHVGPTIRDVTGIDPARLETARRAFEAFGESLGQSDDWLIERLARIDRVLRVVGEGRIQAGDDASYRAYTRLANAGVMWRGKPLTKERYIGSSTQRITERALHAAIMINTLWPALSATAETIRRSLVQD